MSTVNLDELKAIKVLKLTGTEMNGITGQKSLLLWPEQQVLQRYSWAQRWHQEQTKRLIERKQMVVMY